QVFKDATTVFSADSKSTIAHVLTTMDKIDDLITTTIVPARRQRILDSSIRDALKLAKKTMNRYYSATDDSNVYRIATILHPSLKLDYFKLRKWEQPWIDTARELVETEYEIYLEAGADSDDVQIVDSETVC
ncbi:hypothetical protein K438DRAFT_1610686, partial [Mycena galopus ATCC 62051]